jgi:cyclic pyranopterin phosphate synthase
MVGVCIQRMDLCRELDEFLAGDLPGEILRLRETDYAALTS